GGLGVVAVDGQHPGGRGAAGADRAGVGDVALDGAGARQRAAGHDVQAGDQPLAWAAGVAVTATAGSAGAAGAAGHLVLGHRDRAAAEVQGAGDRDAAAHPVAAVAAVAAAAGGAGAAGSAGSAGSAGGLVAGGGERTAAQV